MPLAAWKDEYRTGDATVDRQHEELFMLINALYAAISAGKQREEIAVLVDQLGVQVTDHLATEEELMRTHGYPGFDAHQARHEAIRASAAKVIDDFHSGRSVLTIALSRVLAEWLRHHRDGEDLALIRFMQSRQR